MRALLANCVYSLWAIFLLGLAADRDRSLVTATAAASYNYLDDASWAITSSNLSSLLGNKQQLYDDFMEACKEEVARRDGEKIDCVKDEGFRLTMNSKQPQSVYNYTKEGYKVRDTTQTRDGRIVVLSKRMVGSPTHVVLLFLRPLPLLQKIRAPPELFELIMNFFEENKDKAEVEWKRINTYHNMWESP